MFIATKHDPNHPDLIKARFGEAVAALETADALDPETRRKAEEVIRNGGRIPDEPDQNQ